MAELPERLGAALVDRYVIERELGRGGMATVYLARDRKYHRHVALKVLRPELAAALGAERFLQEIRVTANLQHPHILPLYDSGEVAGFLFYTMPFVAGESLRQRLDRERQLAIEDALKLAEQALAALDYAHRQGVIHRDIKPENILVHEGEAMVADFGIALAVKQAGTERLTETGLLLGTPAYMSPEQAAGDRDIDARSDIYSVGCVLYEMLAGQPPFTGPTARAVLAQQVTKAVPPISRRRSGVSPQVTTAVMKALAKAPGDRFDSAAAFAEAVRPESVASAADLKSIVVLPFVNLSPDPDNAYFADGLTEELISELTKIAALRVISRTSATHYKGTDKDLPTIGRELNVQFVLEGSVRKAGAKLRITAQLIDALADAHLWAEKYSGALEDVFEIQEQVSRAIVESLRVTLSPEEERRISERPTESLEAYDDYLRGLDGLSRGLFRSEYDDAQRMFEQAVERDPTFAHAHAALSRVHTGRYHLGFDRTEQILEKARSAVDRALALRPDLPEAHLALGWLHWTLLNHAEAEAHFRTCLRHQPNDPQLWRLMGLTRMWKGDWQEGIEYQKKAMWLDPRNPAHAANVAFGYRFLRDYEPAVPYYERAIEISPDWIVSYVELAYLYLAWKGATKLARSCLERANRAGAADGWLAPLLRVQLEMYDGDYGSALDRLAAWVSDELDTLHGYAPRPLLLALIHQLGGDRNAAREAFTEAESIARAKVQQQPQDARVHSTLGVALAGLGRADEAIAEGRAFETLAPVTKDGLAPYRVVDLAQIYTLLGRHDAAVRQLEYLVSVPGPHSARWLATDPTWEPLKGHPRFQELLRVGGVDGDA
jgi:serine/threonine protein kinase/Flp pilus assembly protein TadD